MMECRQIRQLLPLWVGQDLPDAMTANKVSKHLEQCHECERRRLSLQTSLEVLQGSSAETLSSDSTRQSVLPKLMLRISEWDNLKRRDRFNGWIPASAMALAVALMVAVSIPSIHDEFFGGQVNSAATLDQFSFSFDYDLDAVRKLDQPDNSPLDQRQSTRGKPVVYRPGQF